MAHTEKELKEIENYRKQMLRTWEMFEYYIMVRHNKDKMEYKDGLYSTINDYIPIIKKQDKNEYIRLRDNYYAYIDGNLPEENILTYQPE